MIHTVNGSKGTLTINPKTGHVLSHTGYIEVMKVDLVEYYNTYPESTREDVDILDVGYWSIPEGKVVYTPPCESWRKERDELA